METLERTTAPRTELVLLVVPLLLVLAIAGLSYQAWLAFHQQTDQLEVSEQVLLNTDALLSSLKDAETSQRGYLLTGNDPYLEPYREATKSIPVRLEALANFLTTRSPDQARQLDALRPLIRAKLDELEQTIALRRNRQDGAAMAIVLSDRGKLTMDTLRGGFAEMQRIANDRLVHDADAAQSSVTRMAWVATAGSVGLFIILVFSAMTIQKGTRRRQEVIRRLAASEEQTRLARDWLETTLVSIGDAVIATDAAGRIAFLNPVAASLTGWAPEHAAGLPLEKIFVIHNEETGAEVENPVTKALREGHVVGLANHTQLTSKDGRQIPIDDSAAPLRDAQGVIIGVVLVFRDVTERRATERREALASAALAATNQELQQFAYAASHDLREPLRTITVYTQLVQRHMEPQLTEKASEYLKFILAGTGRIIQLVDALMAYSKAGEVVEMCVQTVRIEDVLARTLAEMRVAIDDSRAVITHGPLPSLVVDELHFGQLLGNLISNAIKYRRHDGPRIHVSAELQGPEWLFSVSDDGQGIERQYYTVIFDVFKRLHGHDYPGTGIGLATCKKIVERNGGRIWVESEVGKGSTFFFTVPAGAQNQ